MGLKSRASSFIWDRNTSSEWIISPRAASLHGGVRQHRVVHENHHTFFTKTRGKPEGSAGKNHFFSQSFHKSRVARRLLWPSIAEVLSVRYALA